MTNVRQSYATVPWWPARHVIGRSRSLTSGDIAFAPTAWCGTTSAAVASTGSTRSFEIVVGVSHATLGQDLGQDRATSSCLCAPYVGIYGTHRFTFNVAQSLYMRLPIGTDPIVRITADPIRRAVISHRAPLTSSDKLHERSSGRRAAPPVPRSSNHVYRMHPRVRDASSQHVVGHDVRVARGRISVTRRSPPRLHHRPATSSWRYCSPLARSASSGEQSAIASFLLASTGS
jgi:hypothetical protein